MSLKKIKELFSFEKGNLQSLKSIDGKYDFITASSDWKKHNEYTHDCEALIFAAAASGSLGRTHYVNGKFVSSDLCFIITPKDQIKLPVDLKFYQIIFNLYKKEIVAATKAGTSKESIGLKIFGEYELPYFELKLQEKVKQQFENAERIKNSLFSEFDLQLTQIENLNQAILQEAVQGKLVAQNQDDEPASELLKQIQKEKAKLGKKEKTLPPIRAEEVPFEIPESWVWCRLGDLALYSEAGKSYNAEGSSAKENEWGVIKTSAITSGIFEEEENKRLPMQNIDLEKIRIKVGDIIFCRASGSKGLAGKSCIVEKESKSKLILSDKSIRFVFSSNIHQNYIQLYNSTLFAVEYYGKLGTGKSTSMNNIVRDDFNKLPVPLPPLSEQKRIVGEIEKQLTKTKQLKEHIIANQNATEQLLKALLHQAFEIEEN